MQPIDQNVEFCDMVLEEHERDLDYSVYFRIDLIFWRIFSHAIYGYYVLFCWMFVDFLYRQLEKTDVLKTAMKLYLNFLGNRDEKLWGGVQLFLG